MVIAKEEIVVLEFNNVIAGDEMVYGTYKAAREVDLEVERERIGAPSSWTDDSVLARLIAEGVFVDAGVRWITETLTPRKHVIGE